MDDKNTYEMKPFYDDVIALLKEYINDDKITDEELENIIVKYQSIRKKYSDEFKGLYSKNYGLLLPDLEDKIRIEDVNINSIAIDALLGDLYSKLEKKMDKSGGEFTDEVKSIDYKPIREINIGIYPEPIKEDTKSEIVTLKTMQNYLEHLLKVDIIKEIELYNGTLCNDSRFSTLGKVNENYYILTDAGTLYIKRNNDTDDTEASAGKVRDNFGYTPVPPIIINPVPFPKL